MFYIYIPFQGKRIYWNRIICKWLPHIRNASSYTEQEAKDMIDGCRSFGLGAGQFLDK